MWSALISAQRCAAWKAAQRTHRQTQEEKLLWPSETAMCSWRFRGLDRVSESTHFRKWPRHLKISLSCHLGCTITYLPHCFEWKARSAITTYWKPMLSAVLNRFSTVLWLHWETRPNTWLSLSNQCQEEYVLFLEVCIHLIPVTISLICTDLSNIMFDQ